MSTCPPPGDGAGGAGVHARDAPSTQRPSAYGVGAAPSAGMVATDVAIFIRFRWALPGGLASIQPGRLIPGITGRRGCEDSAGQLTERLDSIPPCTRLRPSLHSGGGGRTRPAPGPDPFDMLGQSLNGSGRRSRCRHDRPLHDGEFTFGGEAKVGRSNQSWSCRTARPASWHQIRSAAGLSPATHQELTCFAKEHGMLGRTALRPHTEPEIGSAARRAETRDAHRQRCPGHRRLGIRDVPEPPPPPSTGCSGLALLRAGRAQQAQTRCTRTSRLSCSPFWVRTPGTYRLVLPQAIITLIGPCRPGFVPSAP